MGCDKRRQTIGGKTSAGRAARAGLTVALSGLLWAGAGSPALLGARAAYADGALGKTVDIAVVGADLPTVINLLQQQTGLEFLIQDTGKSFGKVTVALSHATFDKALRTIAYSANATVTRNSDGVYVIRAADDNAAPMPTGPTLSAGPPLSAGGLDTGAAYVAMPAQVAPPLRPAEQNPWRKLPLQHAIPSEVMRIMHWDRDLRVDDPFQRVQMEAQKLNITSTGSSLVNNTDNPYYDMPSVPAGRGSSGGPQANRSVDPQSEAGQAPVPFGPGFPGGNRGGFPGQPTFGPQQGQFQGNPFDQNGGGALPEGVDRIFALQGDNSLFIEATPDGFNRVRDIVKNLDIAPRQVQIKVEFVTASVNDVDAFGINFSLVPYPGIEVNNNQGTQANESSIPQTYVQVAAGNIVAQLFSSLVRTRGKVVQAPLITTTNNVTAQIQITTQIPFITTTNVVGGNGTVTSNTSQNFLPISTGLAVQPRINSDDTITLNLQPQISDVSGPPSLSGGPPPTITQNLTTLRTVRNGETMVLGGLVRKSDNNSQSRIPFFSDLPIIGSLFRNRVTNNSDSELLIFVTPTIINDQPEGPATAAGLNTSVAP